MKARLLIILAVIATVLLITLIAMQFTNEINWTLGDFVVMAILLSITGFLIELTMRIVSNTRNRLIILISIVFLFLLVWAELAVGIFGTPYAGS